MARAPALPTTNTQEGKKMEKTILLAHGGGGEQMNSLINDLIFKIFDNEILRRADDSALLELSSDKIVFSTDSFVVNPIFFKGGDIGKIAVCGSINDASMMGAKPLFLSCALIIEEGFSINELEKVLESMKKTAESAGAKIVCGDTKVVPKGACDKIFINTSVIGTLIDSANPAQICRLKPGAKILLSGDIGRHGAALMASRHEIECDFISDCAPLNAVVARLYESGVRPLAMRDATRGGLSAVLNEWSKAAQKGIKIYEEKIAISDGVMGICELLGFDAYELANEGTFILAVDEKDALNALNVLKKFNENANIIGEILEVKDGVILENVYGSSRYVEEPKGELLPRIC